MDNHLGRGLSFAIQKNSDAEDMSLGSDPMSPKLTLVGLSEPISPHSVRKKTKPRAGNKALYRHDSLKESKILMVTEMRRTDSVLQPDLFQYHNHFEFLGLIGKTNTSEVFRVRHRQTMEIFAVKRSRRRFRTKLQRERCLREIKAVAALPAHPNIVAQYRAWQEAGQFYIQMDYCEGGSLNQVIHPTSGTVPLTDKQLWQVALDVANGLAFLHSHEVVHLDIKPENIYRSLNKDREPGPWRIGDFGLAVAKETTDWEEGDGDYVAPELLQVGREPTPAADVFSLGATLYECATGEKLPRKESSAEAADIVLPDRPQEFETLVKAMLLTDLTERPFANQVAVYANTFLSSLYDDEDDDDECDEGIEMEGRKKELHASTPESVGGSFSFPAGNAAGQPSPVLIMNSNNLQQENNNNKTGRKGRIRWVPSLSPLASTDGHLTPGAAAGLVGLTPPTGGTLNVTGIDNDTHANMMEHKINQKESSAVPPLSLPPRQPTIAGPLNPVSAHRTIDTNPGSFRIHRRDMMSPDSDVNFVSSESDPYTFSCDCDTTSATASDLDFPDIITTNTNYTGQQHDRVNLYHARRLSGLSIQVDANAPSPDVSVPRPQHFGYNRAATPSSPQAPHRGHDNDDKIENNSLESSPSGSCPVSSRSCAQKPPVIAIPTFPLLDVLDKRDTNGNGTGVLLSGRDRISARNTPRYVSPFESVDLSNVVQEAKPNTVSNMVVPKLMLPPSVTTTKKAVRRKRQHSSRKSLVQTLKELNNTNGGSGDCLGSSRSLDFCETSRSIQELMPMRKGARHGGVYHNQQLQPDSALATSPEYELDQSSLPPSGPSTHRSDVNDQIGPKSARHMQPCTAAAAAAALKMNTMTLEDYHNRKDEK